MQFTKQSSEVINKSASLSFARSQQSKPSKEYFFNCELMRISLQHSNRLNHPPPSQKAVQRCQCIVNSISGHSQSPFPYVRFRKEELLRCKKNTKPKRKFNWFSVFLSRLWNPLKSSSFFPSGLDSGLERRTEKRFAKLSWSGKDWKFHNVRDWLVCLCLLAPYGKVVVFPRDFFRALAVRERERERVRESLYHKIYRS
jgi:hypothetical protein